MEKSKVKILLITALIAVGILLIMFGNSGLFGKWKSAATYSDSYSLYAEEKIKSLCERIDGVSDVSVAVSVSDGKISGVGVVCSGGRDPTVEKEIIGVISSAFDIGTNKIYVAEAGK